MTLLLVVYLCSTPINSALTVLVGEEFANIIVNLLLFFCILVTVFKSGFRAVPLTLLLYSSIAIIAMVTLIVHPDYEPWYMHEYYGIARQFLNLKGGIWAVLIIGSYRDDKQLLKDMSIAAAFVFIAYFGKFIAAIRRGYWIVTDLNGVERHASYDMEFGYRLLFPVALWGSRAILEKKRHYSIMYALGLLAILLGGSRGSVIWALVLYLAAIPFKYRSLPKDWQRVTLILGLVAIPVLVFVPLNADALFTMLGKTLSSFGLSSRTIDAMTNGGISESKGRSIIYAMSWELIKTGGPLGRGFYGDRTYIGTRFRWGYSHDIFLELLVTFGFVGGAIAIAALTLLIVKLYRKAITTDRQIVFLSFFVASLKLILSSSFWYEPTFWALIGLSVLWTGNISSTASLTRRTSVS